MEGIIRVYLTNKEIKDITDTYPQSNMVRNYEDFIILIKNTLEIGYKVELYYEDTFIVTMQDILSRLDNLEHLRTYRIMDYMVNDFYYVYKPGGRAI